MFAKRIAFALLAIALADSAPAQTPAPVKKKEIKDYLAGAFGF